MIVFNEIGVFSRGEGTDIAISDLLFFTDALGNEILLTAASEQGGLAGWDVSDIPALKNSRNLGDAETAGSRPEMTLLADGTILIVGLGDGASVGVGPNLSGGIGGTYQVSLPAGAWDRALGLEDGRLVLADGTGTGLTVAFDAGTNSYGTSYTIADTAFIYTDGIVAIREVTVGSQTIVLTAAAGDAGVSSFDLDAATWSALDGQGQSDGFGMLIPTSMEVITIGGTAFAIIGSAQGASGVLTVFEVTPAGGLLLTDTVQDTLDSRFSAVSDISIVDTPHGAFLVAAGADDGLSLFALTETGQLVHLGAYADSLTAGLTNPNVVELVAGDTGLILYVSSEGDAGFTVIEVPYSSLPEIHSGAAVLTGTAGSDLFVVDPGVTTQINGFDATTDVIDLSHWAMLYDAGQVQINISGMTATLSYRDHVLTLNLSTSASAAQIEAALQIPINRSPEAPSRVFNGTSGADVIMGTWGQDTLAGQGGHDALTGGEGDDVLSGGAGDDTLEGGGGDDSLFGGSGNDLLFGGAGNDLLEPGSGTDQLFGGDGVDTAVLDWALVDLLDVQESGEDLILSFNGQTVTLTGVETVQFTDQTVDASDLVVSNDPVTIDGTNGSDSLSHLNGPATLNGFGGNDTLTSGAYDDLLYGGGGDDTLSSGAGADTLVGGTGSDLLYAGAGGDVLSGGGGFDNLYGGGGNDFLAGGDAADQLFGEGGDDTLLGEGGSDDLDGGDGDDTLLDYFGNNDLKGGDGADILLGGFRDDTLDGGAGNDVLIADPFDEQGGCDTLIGGQGNDLLSGGMGADVFVFRPADGIDTIAAIGWGGPGYTNPGAVGADFDPNVDTLDLTAFGFSSVAAVMNAFSQGVDGAVFQSNGTSVTLVGVDLSDLGSADFFIF